MRGVKQDVDWIIIRAEFIAGTLTYRQLAAKHGVTYHSLKKRGSEQDWADERREQAERVAAELQAKTFTRRVSQLKDWNEKDLRIATALRAKLSRLLKVSDDVEDASDGLAVLRAIAVAAESIQRMGRLALGATTNNQGLSDPEGAPLTQPTLNVIIDGAAQSEFSTPIDVVSTNGSGTQPALASETGSRISVKRN